MPNSEMDSADTGRRRTGMAVAIAVLGALVTGVVPGTGPVDPVSAGAAVGCPDGSTLIETDPAPVTPTCYQIFTASGTFTTPADVTAVDVLVVGGGGGGAQGGFIDGQVLSGGGGGGGAVNLQTGVAVTGDVTVTVGAGGAGGVVDCTTVCPSTGAAGGNGGESSFGSTIAAGGTGGSGGATGPVAGDGGASGNSNAGGSDVVTTFGLGGATFSGGGGGGGAGGPGGAATTPNTVCHTGDEDPTDGATSWVCGGDGGKGLLPTGGSFTSAFWTLLSPLSVTTYGFGPGGAGAVVGLWRDFDLVATDFYFASGRGVDLNGTPLSRGILANGADAKTTNFANVPPSVPDGSSTIAWGWDEATYGGGGSGGTGGPDAPSTSNSGSAGTDGIVIVTFPAGEVTGGPVTGVDGDPMELVFRAEVANDSAAVLLGSPFYDGGSNGPPETVQVRVDWGDGTTVDYTDVGFWTHSYASPGDYTVKIWPLFADAGGSDTGPWLTLYGADRFGVFGEEWWGALGDTRDGDVEVARLIQVVSFGDLGITSLRNAFNRHHDLVDVPNNVPSAVTDLGYTFFRATSFNDADVGAWNVSNVTNMQNMFENADLFNQPLNGWDVSNVTDMSDLFEDAIAFNQNLDLWDVSSATDMNNMFENAASFNGNIATWKNKVSQVVNFADFLYDAVSFSQDLPDWDVSGANDLDSFFENATAFNGSLTGWVFDTDPAADIDMSNFFEGATLFNQPLSSWVTTGFGNTNDMFFEATAFNQDISGWDVSNVDDMNDMFNLAVSFDQALSAWNVSKVTNMSSMFRGAVLFNQDISGWDVSNATNMSSMFRGAVLFDQELSAWNVSSVDDMSSMFNLATAFDRSLGDWTLNANVSLGSMLNSSGMSTSCYDATLNGWAGGPEVTGRGLGASGVFYTAAGAIGRTALIDTRGWTITDAGLSTELAGNCMKGEIAVVVTPVAEQSIEYGDDPDLSFTDDLPDGVDWITEPTCAVYLEDLEVAPSALTEVTERPVPVGEYIVQCSGGELPDGYVADFETTGTLSVTKAQAPLTYTGTSGVVPTGGSLTLTATLSPEECTGEITYLVNGAPPPGSYADGIYEIEVTYAGDENCESATVYAIAVVGGANAASNGGGHYNVSGAGKINFGYTVQVNKSRTGSVQVSGQILWNSQNGKFRFKGVISGFVKTTTDCASGAICGRIVGTGTLRVRDDEGEWMVVSSNMTFKASVIDAGTVSVCSGGRKRTCTTVNRTDLFGLDLLGSDLTGEQTSPASGWPTPVLLGGGNILIK